MRDKETLELMADLIKNVMSATVRRGFQVATKNHYSLDTNLKLAISPLQSFKLGLLMRISTDSTLGRVDSTYVCTLSSKVKTRLTLVFSLCTKYTCLWDCNL